MSKDLEQIKKAVNDYLKVDISEKNRRAQTIKGRLYFYYLADKYTKKHHRDIGAFFDKDRNTIRHALANVKSNIKTYKEDQRDILLIEQNLGLFTDTKDSIGNKIKELKKRIKSFKKLKKQFKKELTQINN